MQQQQMEGPAAVKSLRQSVRSFWKLYGACFTSWWKSQDVASRRAFILEYTRGMPESSDDPHYTEDDGTRANATGHLVMLPELTVRQLSEGPEHLPGLFRRRAAHADQLEALEREHGVIMFQGDEEWKDLEWMRRVHASGMLRKERPRDIFIMLGDNAGEFFTPKGGRTAQQRVQQLLANGGAVEADIAVGAYQRQTFLLTSLTVVADAFRQDVLGKQGSKHGVQGLGCANCAAPEAQGGGPLKTCGKCGVVGYCGRECQLAHWRAGHKQECARLKQDGGEGGAAGGGGGGSEAGSGGRGGAAAREAAGEEATAVATGGGKAGVGAGAKGSGAGSGGGGTQGGAGEGKGSEGGKTGGSVVGSGGGGGTGEGSAVGSAVAQLEGLRVD